MIQLPPGFDVSLFFADLYAVAVPFVSIAVLFVGFRYVVKVLKG